MNMTGRIPKEFGNLVSLQELDLVISDDVSVLIVGFLLSLI